GQTGAVSTGTYTPLAASTVTALDPTTGGASATLVTLTGTSFGFGTSDIAGVSMGVTTGTGSVCSSATWLSATSLTCSTAGGLTVGSAYKFKVTVGGQVGT